MDVKGTIDVPPRRDGPLSSLRIRVDCAAASFDVVIAVGDVADGEEIIFAESEEEAPAHAECNQRLNASRTPGGRSGHHGQENQEH